MLGLSPWVSFLAVLVAAVLARAIPAGAGNGVRRALDSRAAPFVVGVIGALLSWWVWGSLDQTAVMHDESAYLLQAELFAHLRWAGQGHSLPQFFEQLYVLVDRVTASKYAPGNSLILATGAVVGLPGLPVVLMNGGASALMFGLARRLAGSSVALLTWIVWQSSFPTLYFHATYMSEGVTSFAWLVTWWGVLRWRDGAARRWLVLAAAAAAWCLITRPLTGVALSLVVIAVVVGHCRRTARWRDLSPATAAVIAVLCVLPLWSWATTGDVRATPLGEYTRDYVPFDKPGFGVRPEDRPAARLPRDQWITSAAFYQEHERHTLGALPATARQRLAMIDRDAWYEWRGGLRPFALIGLIVLPIEGWIVLAGFLLQFGLYLSYAHPPGWTLYYLEGTPILAFVTALGLVSVLGATVRGGTPRFEGGLTSIFAQLRRALMPGVRSDSPRTVLATMIVGLTGVVAGTAVARQVRSKIHEDHAYFDAFSQLIRQIPESRVIVFVRYGEKHLDGLSLVRNVADPEHAKVWTVYDRGADNTRLLAAAPDRAAYLFDESSWTLRPLRGLSPNGRAIASAMADSVRERRAGRRPR
jgi:hypothetical protein